MISHRLRASQSRSLSKITDFLEWRVTERAFVSNPKRRGVPRTIDRRQIGRHSEAMEVSGNIQLHCLWTQTSAVRLAVNKFYSRKSRKKRTC